MTYRFATVPLLLILAVLVGCSDGKDLESASEGLIQARSRLERANEEFERTEAVVEAAVAKRTVASDAVAEAERRVAEARTEVKAHTNDDAVFRAVQKRLLEDAGLENVAIAATVENGVVSLTGSVPSSKVRELAANLARRTLGVVKIKNQITIDVAAPPAE